MIKKRKFKCIDYLRYETHSQNAPFMDIFAETDAKARYIYSKHLGIKYVNCLAWVNEVKTFPKEKPCIKCGEKKPLDDYYSSKNTIDGHVGDCKICRKKLAANTFKQNKGDPEFIEKERERFKERYHRLGYNKKYKTRKRR